MNFDHQQLDQYEAVIDDPVLIWHPNVHDQRL
jgi:hypothetical protein